MEGSRPASESKRTISKVVFFSINNSFILCIVCVQKKAVELDHEWIFSTSTCAVTTRTMTPPDRSQRGAYQTSMRWICNPLPCLA